MTSHDTPTPEALQITVPHFSLQALTHLIAAITPLLPPAPKRGPKGMAITTRVRLALSYLREGVSIRGLARISGIPVTTLRDNIGPILEAFDRLAPLLPDGTIIGDFDDIAWWCAETGGTIIVDGTELAIARPTGQVERLFGLQRGVTVSSGSQLGLPVEQRPYYSGKKKTHTLKTIAVCDAESNLLWVTPLLGGATHDLTALRDANPHPTWPTPALTSSRTPGSKDYNTTSKHSNCPPDGPETTASSPRPTGSSTRCCHRTGSVSNTASAGSSNGGASPSRNNTAPCSNDGSQCAGRSPRSNKPGPDHETPRRSNAYTPVPRRTVEATVET